MDNDICGYRIKQDLEEDMEDLLDGWASTVYMWVFGFLWLILIVQVQMFDRIHQGLKD